MSNKVDFPSDEIPDQDPEENREHSKYLPEESSSDNNEKEEDRNRQIDGILLRMYRYYEKEPPGVDVLELYHAALKKYSVANIRKAAGHHIKTCKWFPKISELIDLMPSDDDHIPEIESRARTQAAEILDYIRRNGYRYEPSWTDPITAVLMRTRWKWTSLCETSTVDNEVWFVKEFVEAYNALADCRGENKFQIESATMKRLCDLTKGMLKDVDPKGVLSE